MRRAIELRFMISLALSAVVGTVGIHVWPLPIDDPILGLIHAVRPTMFAAFSYMYAAVWFTTPLIVISACLSTLYIFGARSDRREAFRSLPPYPAPEQRDDLFLVLG